MVGGKTWAQFFCSFLLFLGNYSYTPLSRSVTLPEFYVMATCWRGFSSIGLQRLPLRLPLFKSTADMLPVRHDHLWLSYAMFHLPKHILQSFLLRQLAFSPAELLGSRTEVPSVLGIHSLLSVALTFQVYVFSFRSMHTVYACKSPSPKSLGFL